MNAKITNEIAELALQEFENLAKYSSTANISDLGRVRESLKHFVRDWSVEGAHERARIFQPILNVLRQVDPDSRPEKKVLVPGSGLGKLAWEIS
jgi:carnosine N-methyltransferase